MARVDTLEHFLTDVASAIKHQTGDAADIYPSQFDTIIYQLSTSNTQTKTVTPTTSQQTIIPDTGYTAFSEVTVNAVTSAIDNNIQAGNIKSGVTILGVTGSYEGGGGGRRNFCST